MSAYIVFFVYRYNDYPYEAYEVYPVEIIADSRELAVSLATLKIERLRDTKDFRIGWITNDIAQVFCATQSHANNARRKAYQLAAKLSKK